LKADKHKHHAPAVLRGSRGNRNTEGSEHHRELYCTESINIIIILLRKGVGGMNTSKIQRETINSPLEPYRFTKRLGSTTYHVVVHFNPEIKDTAGEKIARLVRNEAVAGKAVNQ
jgi:hypothetical protein